MSYPIKVAQFGLGPIGQNCVHLLANDPRFQVVGAVDINPQFVGQAVAAVCGLEGKSCGTVHGSFEDLWAARRPEAVLHTAGSRAAVSFSQCRPMLEQGVAVVSSCEELLFPMHRAPEETRAVDALCRRSGGRILGTGVNPGFVLDVLPVALSMVACSVRGVEGRRVVNASLRRHPLQKKIGSGLAPEEFRRLWREGKAGHAGFQESLRLLAHALGWKMGTITEDLEPVIAEREVRTEFFHVQPGQTRGLHQTVSAVSDQGCRIHLDLTMALDEESPQDRVILDSEPALEVVVPGGVSGDRATVASLVNALPRLLCSAPGVRLMTDLPLASVFSRRENP